MVCGVDSYAYEILNEPEDTQQDDAPLPYLNPLVLFCLPFSTSTQKTKHRCTHPWEKKVCATHDLLTARGKWGVGGVYIPKGRGKRQSKSEHDKHLITQISISPFHVFTPSPPIIGNAFALVTTPRLCQGSPFCPRPAYTHPHSKRLAPSQCLFLLSAGTRKWAAANASHPSPLPPFLSPPSHMHRHAHLQHSNDQHPRTQAQRYVAPAATARLPPLPACPPCPACPSPSFRRLAPAPLLPRRPRPRGLY